MASRTGLKGSPLRPVTGQLQLIPLNSAHFWAKSAGKTKINPKLLIQKRRDLKIS
jgi:hypothetical protein